MTPDTAHLYNVIDGTWPAAATKQTGPFLLRRGDGGGQRVSAATALAPASNNAIDAAETAMLAMGQPRLFQIRAGDDALDAALAARGYAVVDPVNLYLAPVAQLLTDQPPPITTFALWEPLAIQIDIWAKGGIGPGRIAVMHRAKGPKTSILGRLNDHPGGTAFVAIHDNIAMVHAIEVLPHQRQQGMARWFMRSAALWAQEHGTTHIAVVCTRANRAANALYASLGMALVGQYHYRKHPDDMK
ncbi:MAG: GNAT family N-acetyltransferase [Paracoccaceae bacterium]|uniref:GNAT family N-acetyltransferase n=1 Tax=Seohaeicola saemankumensis TaxID=481181 RepID=UPI001E53A885|nr:GNAT family N-acetyltransferase [Seohaeicola saemankumensis]MCD1624797.1 GNAT family N-acetyltransferase [Seohaeicola saemankumensis]